MTYQAARRGSHWQRGRGGRGRRGRRRGNRWRRQRSLWLHTIGSEACRVTLSAAPPDRPRSDLLHVLLGRRLQQRRRRWRSGVTPTCQTLLVISEKLIESLWTQPHGLPDPSADGQRPRPSFGLFRTTATDARHPILQGVAFRGASRHSPQLHGLTSASIGTVLTILVDAEADTTSFLAPGALNLPCIGACLGRQRAAHFPCFFETRQVLVRRSRQQRWWRGKRLLSRPLPTGRRRGIGHCELAGRERGQERGARGRERLQRDGRERRAWLGAGGPLRRRVLRLHRWRTW